MVEASRPPSTPIRCRVVGITPRKRYSKPSAKNRMADLLGGIRAIDALEGLGVAGSLQRVHVRAEAPAVEPVDALRGHERALRFGHVGVGVREKVRAEDDQIEAEDDHRARHRHLVLPEPPPHELPLRRHEDALLGGGVRAPSAKGGARGIEGQLGLGHHVSSSRMRGSTQTSRRSEINVPITVMTPSSSTMVPARNISWAIKALRRSGPDRRQSQHDGHDDAPRHDVRERVADGAREGIERHPHRVLQDHGALGKPLGARRHHIGLAQLIQQIGSHDPDLLRGAGESQDQGRDRQMLQEVPDPRRLHGASCSSGENSPPMWALNSVKPR